MAYKSFLHACLRPKWLCQGHIDKMGFQGLLVWVFLIKCRICHARDCLQLFKDVHVHTRAHAYMCNEMDR